VDAAGLAALQDASFARANAATRTSYPPERRMTGAQLERYLAQRRYAVVASTRADGRPHAALTAYVCVGGQLWLPAVAGSARARNVAQTPAVSLVLSDGEGDDHAAVVLEGDVSLVPDAEAPGDVTSAYADRHGRAPDWANEWLVVTPTRLLSYVAEGRTI
jgi:nitroimidazol reductase NimA-like FMN-containing flavoprotein (pyridoxamine 5'-phosphate oxidase superfamily)